MLVPVCRCCSSEPPYPLLKQNVGANISSCVWLLVDGLLLGWCTVGVEDTHFPVKEVSADKAYLSHKNLAAVEAVGATPFVSFKSNTVEPEAGDSTAWAQMYHYFMGNQEKFLEHYHQRPNVETAYSMMKGKFGDSLRSKSDVGQINEALCKVLCHNICVLVQATYELGIGPTF